ncbi:MAG: MarR family winged helix-turn-helix transcriptional regulator [Oligoflexus sp.]
MSTATILFHEAVSGQLGLNPTDTKCMGMIVRSKVPVTAGDLVQFTGLTTGAVTGVIDRLEKVKLVKRVRDAKDRRKVYLVPDQTGARKLLPLYSSLRSSVEKLAASYTESELPVIVDYLEKSVALLERETRKIRKGDHT